MISKIIIKKKQLFLCNSKFINNIITQNVASKFLYMVIIVVIYFYIISHIIIIIIDGYSVFMLRDTTLNILVWWPCKEMKFLGNEKK